jgi:catechol 2,3-dioxygenase-like lactoylglutathione lyase family enzyme
MTQPDETATGGQAWPGGIAAITLVAEDLPAARQFYLDVFGLPVVFEDDSSAVFAFGGTLVNLLAASEAPVLVAPVPVADPAAGARSVLTLEVADVDAHVDLLAGRGAAILSGPVDRPWGIRTASFRDPTGQLWELAGPLAEDA